MIKDVKNNMNNLKKVVETKMKSSSGTKINPIKNNIGTLVEKINTTKINNATKDTKRKITTAKYKAVSNTLKSGGKYNGKKNI